MSAIRAAEWGHWGVTFYMQKPGAYAPDAICGYLPFPVGACGPNDSDRERYTAAIRDWKERGVLPNQDGAPACRVCGRTQPPLEECCEWGHSADARSMPQSSSNTGEKT
jgi:hypothetical protein